MGFFLYWGSELDTPRPEAPPSLREAKCPPTWPSAFWSREGLPAGHAPALGTSWRPWPSWTTARIHDVLAPWEPQPLCLGCPHFVPYELIRVKPLYQSTGGSLVQPDRPHPDSCSVDFLRHISLEVSDFPSDLEVKPARTVSRLAVPGAQGGLAGAARLRSPRLHTLLPPPSSWVLPGAAGPRPPGQWGGTPGLRDRGLSGHLF